MIDQFFDIAHNNFELIVMLAGQNSAWNVQKVDLNNALMDLWINNVSDATQHL